MEVNQIYEIVNTITQETLGVENLVNEDLSNIVDVGTEVFNQSQVDNYVRSLVDHIGKVVFVNRPYQGSAPSVLMDGWEYGRILEKIKAEMPVAQANESWELEDGVSYDPNMFYKPSVSAKFFNKAVTFEVPMSFTEMQIKESFSNATQLNGFMSMLYTAIDKSMTVKLDGLVMRTINNMIGETVHDDFGSSPLSGGSGIKAVNLLKLYNTDFSKSLTASVALTDPDFIRYAAFKMGVYESRLMKISKLFNIGGKDRFTTSDILHVVLLSDFARAADAYLQSDTFHNEFVKLPKAETVPYWQGSGTTYSFSDVSKIDVKTTSGDTVEVPGILGVMFDRDALGVTNINKRVTSNYNPKAEFWNNWYKYDSGYFNDFDENFVVFFMA